jgi:hypothetical protein
MRYASTARCCVMCSAFCACPALLLSGPLSVSRCVHANEKTIVLTHPAYPLMIKVVTTRFTLYSSRVCMRYHMRMSIPARSPTHYVALVQALGAKSFAGGGRQSAVSECAELVAAVLQRREDRSTVGHDVRRQTKQTVASEVITRHVDDHASSSSRTPSSTSLM